MASATSHRPTSCNLDKLSVIVVQMPSYYACAEVTYLKSPHPTIIGEDMRSDSGWFLGGFGVVRPLARDLLGGS